MKSQYGLIAIILFFVFGLSLAIYSPRFSKEDDRRKVVDGSSNASQVSRDPAAIRRTYDFSGLDGSALAKAQKQRLLSGAKVVHEKSNIGVELGHFVLKGEDGQKAFACQKYGKITMTFVADGSAVNGELPKMEVEGLCEMASDVNSISPLWIPIAKILGEPVGDGEFSFKEDRPISVRFANVSDQWPTSWQLQSVRLFTTSKEVEEVVIPAQELRQYLPNPILLNWK